MQLLHGNYLAFFLLQAITWIALIGIIYFLAKTLKTKHLFLTPFLLLFGGVLFVDNYVGNFENDYMAIVIFLTALTIYFKTKNKTIPLLLFGLGTSIWLWVGYIRPPNFWSTIAEQNWWAQILVWGLLTPIYLYATYKALIKIIKLKGKILMPAMLLFSFAFPKLWFLAIPQMLIVIDKGLTKLDYKKNYKLWMAIIIFALLLGQTMRVGIQTYQAWSYDTSQTNCFTVNHEYFARLQGKSLYYNQATIYEYNECLKKERNEET